MSLYSICSKCGCDNTQPVALVVAGVINPESCEKTKEIAEKYSLKPRPSALLPWIVVGCGFYLSPLALAAPIIAYFSGLDTTFVVLAILSPALIGLGILYHYIVARKQRKWDRMVSSREAMWFCTKCGNEWGMGGF